MSGPLRSLVGALVALGLGSSSAWACHGCKQPACSGVPVCQTQYRCVTEMVPYTVMRTQMKVDWHPETCTVMVPVPHTTWTERPVTICVPRYETVPVTRRYTVCRLVPETTMVDQTVTVCEAVQSTEMVTETTWQASSRTVAVPVKESHGCLLGSLCGKQRGTACGGCQYVTQTCYTPVPITRAVPVTRYVPRTITRQVPVTTCRWVTEERVDTRNIVRFCGVEPRTEMRRVPCTTVQLEPKTFTKMVATCRQECVPVTLYRPVTRVVPVVCAPAVAGPAMSVAPSTQGPAPSAQ